MSLTSFPPLSPNLYAVDLSAPLPLQELMRSRLKIDNEKVTTFWEYILPKLQDFYTTSEKRPDRELRFSRNTIRNQAKFKVYLTSVSGWLKTLSKNSLHLQVISDDPYKKYVGTGDFKKIKASISFFITKDTQGKFVAKSYPSVLWTCKEYYKSNYEYNLTDGIRYELIMYDILSNLFPSGLIGKTPIKYNAYIITDGRLKLECNQDRYLFDAKKLFSRGLVALDLEDSSSRRLEWNEVLEIFLSSARTLFTFDVHQYVYYDMRCRNICFESSETMQPLMIDFNAVDPVYRDFVPNPQNLCTIWDEITLKYGVLTPQMHVIELVYAIAHYAIGSNVENNRKREIVTENFIKLNFIENVRYLQRNRYIAIKDVKNLDEFLVEIETLLRIHSDGAVNTFLKTIKLKTLLIKLAIDVLRNDIEMFNELVREMPKGLERKAEIEFIKNFYETNREYYFPLIEMIVRLEQIKNELTQGVSCPVPLSHLLSHQQQIKQASP